jgi:hypothetical protein
LRENYQSDLRVLEFAVMASVLITFSEGNIDWFYFIQIRRAMTARMPPRMSAKMIFFFLAWF